MDKQIRKKTQDGSVSKSGEKSHRKKESDDRSRELACINYTNSVIREGKGIAETLQKICLLLPEAWQYPEHTVARLRFKNESYTTPGFKESPWCLRQAFETIEEKSGSIEIFYTDQFVQQDEGPFLKEERELIQSVANAITGYLNSLAARAQASTRGPAVPLHIEKEERGVHIASRKLLQKFLNKSNFDRDLYHDLMPFKVRDILMVANLYDAYSIEREGRFSEHVLGEYSQMNLTSVPRITGVSSADEAVKALQDKHYDLVIIMMGADKKSPIGLSCLLKKDFPYVPVFLLLNNNQDVAIFHKDLIRARHFDKIFVWNGESRVFFAMIKNVEDRINIENDTKIGLVRVILLVEDSPIYYSRYMSILYQVLLEQTKRIIDDVSTDELYKVLRMRARPKILHVSTYEEAIEIARRYQDYLLCLITDVTFFHNGIHEERAGLDLVREIKQFIPELPTVIQSSNADVAGEAEELNASFIYKNSTTLMQDLRSFITHYLGFGDFIYRNNSGVQIAIARSLREFENHLATIPEESLLYHARMDHFSLWLMARGEIQAAKILNPQKVTDFKNPKQLREHLLEVIRKFRNEQNAGKIVPFVDSSILSDANIVSLSPGSLGGKGRGTAFINTLISNYDFSQHLPYINIKAPVTSVIGAEEFELFMERNNIMNRVAEIYDYDTIKKIFLDCPLSDRLMARLEMVLQKITKPIAVRSSGLFEDSLSQPFAGIFETFLLPNSHPDLSIRVQQASDAIKLVYASVFSVHAKAYIEAIHYNLEEEKMAVVFQEVVGHKYGKYFYPHMSGVALSYNYYPFAHMQPEEGFAVVAVGLGKYVVEGEKAYRFSPRYPTLDINSPKDQFKNSQVEFFAVDLSKKDVQLLEGDTAGLARIDIDEAERHGTLKHMVSVYDIDNDSITPGLDKPGPRIVNFANILKYNYVPLAKTLETVLDVVKEAMGTAVEIEFALDLQKDKSNKATFYILQIKPLLGSAQDYTINMNEINKDNILLYSERCMGNGLVKGIQDVIYVDKNAFDKTKTIEIAAEIDSLNSEMIKDEKQYIVIGPGRWGTRDRFIGVPVNWAQISNAKVIVETSLEGFPLDASSGSHFFHNVTSMNVGYMSVQPEMSKSFIKWDVLEKQELISETKYCRHVRFATPIDIRMDGRKRISVISWE